MSDLVKRLRMSCTPIECEAADEIEQLTEALKRDVVDETRNAELNSAKDAAIAELVELMRETRQVIMFFKPETHAYGCGTLNRLNIAMDKYDTTGKEGK